MEPAQCVYVASGGRPLHGRAPESVHSIDVHVRVGGEQFHRGPMPSEDGPVEGGGVVFHAHCHIRAGFLQQVPHKLIARGDLASVLARKHERRAPRLVARIDGHASLFDQETCDLHSPVTGCPHQRRRAELINGVRRWPTGGNQRTQQ